MKGEEFQQTAEHAQITVRASVKNWCVVSNVREKEHRTANKKRKLELVMMRRDLNREQMHFSMTAPSNADWTDAVTKDSNNVRNKVPSPLEKDSSTVSEAAEGRSQTREDHRERCHQNAVKGMVELRKDLLRYDCRSLIGE